MMVQTNQRTATASTVHDPLVAAINHYLFAGEAYDSLPEGLSDEEERVHTDRLLAGPNDVLVDWRWPAGSEEGAVAALRLALKELEEGEGEPIVISLVRAALGYFDKNPDAESNEHLARAINRDYDRLVERAKVAGQTEAIAAAQAGAYASIAFLDQSAGRRQTMALLGDLIQSS